MLAVQPTAVPTWATRVTALTVLPMCLYLRASSEMGKTAQLVTMRRQIPTIQAPVQPAATAPTAATAVTVIMVHLMYLYLQASTEAAKAARLVQINLLTLHIQATAAQATAARGLAMLRTI